MANRIRGKKRQEIIDNWIKGIEDPDVEVKPTKKENRYIVRPKKSNEETKTEQTEDESVEEEREPKKSPIKKEQKEQTSESEYEYEYEYEEEPERSNTELLQYEILNELKRMNDEKATRRAEKQRQKELKNTVKYQMMKQFSRQQQQQINEPQQPQRRRLNLLKRLL